MEFIGMNKKEFRAKLYQTYIGLGIQDHAVIQGYIKAAETDADSETSNIKELLAILLTPFNCFLFR